jgi:hypothetical protein
MHLRMFTSMVFAVCAWLFLLVIVLKSLLHLAAEAKSSRGRSWSGRGHLMGQGDVLRALSSCLSRTPFYKAMRALAGLISAPLRRTVAVGPECPPDGRRIGRAP